MNRGIIGNAAIICSLVMFIAYGGHASGQEKVAFSSLTGISSESDSDNFHTFRIRAGALYPYSNPWNFAGFAVQATSYIQNDYHRNSSSLFGIYRNQQRDTLAGVDVEAGVAEVAGHHRPVGQASWRLMPAPDTAVDLSLSADLIETPTALERGLGYTFASGGIEQKLGERTTATGFAGWQAFSDGNARAHLRGRLIWLAVPDDGITLQLRYRQYLSKNTNVEKTYFNPSTYQQWLGVAAIRKRYAGWVFNGAVGAGRERSGEDNSHPSYLLEANAEKLIGAYTIIFRSGYSRSAGFINSPDYSYRFVGATLVIPF